MNEQCQMGGQHMHLCSKRLSWSAVIAGALVAVGLGFLLNLFSVAIGLSVVKTNTGMSALAVGGFIGLLIGAIASMFTAGFVSGYLGRPYCAKRNLGSLYGFVTWSLALILTIIFTAQMGRYVAGYSMFVSNPNQMVMMMKKGRPDTSGMATATKTKATAMPATTTTPEATQTFAYMACLMFVLFFVGAVSSAFGGHCGMSCCGKDETM